MKRDLATLCPVGCPTEGTGLGFLLAYDIVTKGHGGTITVESVEVEGITFIVRLPM